MYAAEGGSIHGEERENLERYLARGGGIVVLHDAVCGDDPHWFKTVVGGAWEHGHARWHEGSMGLYFDEVEHPITEGLANFDLDDEVYYELHLDPEARVIATSFRTPHRVEPQAWVLERDDYRAFVSIQGHNHTTFSQPAWQAFVLRGIAWAGKRHVDQLLSDDEVAALRYPEGGPTAPERAHESFELHPDFEIELVAAEPDVINPISIDWDERGRTWVALTPGYPYKEEFSGVPAHDRIVILSDGDGPKHVETVFHEGLDLVTSLLVWKDGAIVTAAPGIWYLEDTDGDDVADEAHLLYDGFGYGDTHATTSNMRLGLDGWVYATQGYSGGRSDDIQNAAGESFGAIRNGLFRFKPDGSAIELVSSYGSNTWGLDFGLDGELFFTMANGSHLRHVVLEEAVLADARVNGVNSWTHLPDHKQANRISTPDRSVYEQIDFVGGFTAAAGSLIYDGGTWPEEYRGNHFVCEPTVNLVHRDVLESDGVTFVARKPRDEEFLASTDLWFRPVHLRTGPDGALYVLDFYNQAAVHNDTRGPEHGPTNAAVRPDRDRTHGRIWRIDHKAPVAERRDERGELEELWRRGRTGSTDERIGVVRDALASDDPGVRASTARLAGDLVHANAAAALVSQLIDVALDETAPRARLRALVALADAQLDPDQLHALVGSYSGLKDDWTRSAAMRLFLSRPQLSFGMAEHADEIDLLVELSRQLARRRNHEAIGDALVALENNASKDELLAVLPVLSEGMAGMEQRGHWSGTSALAGLLGADLEVAVATLPLVPYFVDEDYGLLAGVQKLSSRLLAVVRDPNTSYDECRRALVTLFSNSWTKDEAISEAPAFLEAHVPLDVQLEIIAGLATTGDAHAATVLAAALPDLGASAREAAFDALLERPAWIPALLDVVESGDVGVHDLGPRRAHRLRSLDDEALAARARAALPTGSSASTAEKVAELLPLVTAPADTARGKQLFAQECGICHVYGDEGASIGPELTGIGAHGVEELLGIVVDPNAEIDPAYLEYVAKTLDGRLVSGIVVRETPDRIVLRNTGGDVELRRDELESLRSSGLSLMPSGLETLGTDVIRDILAYLTEEYAGYQVLDLSVVASARSSGGLFDPEHDWSGWRFAAYGVLDLDGVPFEVPDPELANDGLNVLALRGGASPSWKSRTDYPQRVEIPVGRLVERVHVLGGVGGWAYPWDGRTGEDVVTWTWIYADGERESVVLKNGVELADWIGRYEVPGSTLVEGLLASDSPGQVRRFAMTPSRDVEVRAIELESAESHVSPVFVALTAELPGAPDRPQIEEPPLPDADVWILGGGSHHDFARWFRDEDVALLTTEERAVAYTELQGDVVRALESDDVLVLCTNQPLGPATRAKIEEHVAAGGALVGLHPGTWLNWPDWTELGELLRAGAQSHEPLQAFRVELTDASHPAVAGVEREFELIDELYRLEVPSSDAVRVLARGTSIQTGASYPVVWEALETPGRVLGITLGHDGRAHEHPAFRQLLRSALDWLEEER